MYSVRVLLRAALIDVPNCKTHLHSPSNTPYLVTKAHHVIRHSPKILALSFPQGKIRRAFKEISFFILCGIP